MPLVQIFHISKRLKGRSDRSIFKITLLTILATFLLSIIVAVTAEVAISFRNEPVKCDMTIPAIIGIDFFLIIVIPIIGIIGGSIHYFRRSSDQKA